MSTCNPLLRVFGKSFLEELNPLRISEYQRQRLQAVGKNTINRELAVLRKVFNLGIRWGMVKDNPVKQVDFFKVRLCNFFGCNFRQGVELAAA